MEIDPGSLGSLEDWVLPRVWSVNILPQRLFEVERGTFYGRAYLRNAASDLNH